ncbi:hypothetical protein PIB30_041779 [Stylosanthes scabra]|uniref:Uncharacterized protein n=1 Tax=Stylosanthes scabra TaxID=79078 RepID=A0ABU6UDN8_9FABA|nr:hypothetical protein [Stylosanthes scabra]
MWNGGQSTFNSERRKNISVKRMRAEETSRREKLIDLMSSKCCGRDVSLDEHFQSKADFALIEEAGDMARGQFMKVMAARLWCMGRYEELKGKKKMEHKKEESAELQKIMERERKLQLAMEQVALKDKELLDLKSENEELKGCDERPTAALATGSEFLN